MVGGIERYSSSSNSVWERCRSVLWPLQQQLQRPGALQGRWSGALQDRCVAPVDRYVAGSRRYRVRSERCRIVALHLWIVLGQDRSVEGSLRYTCGLFRGPAATVAASGSVTGALQVSSSSSCSDNAAVAGVLRWLSSSSSCRDNAAVTELNGQIGKWIRSLRGIDQYSTDQVT